jgi:hypothetical protein
MPDDAHVPTTTIESEPSSTTAARQTHIAALLCVIGMALSIICGRIHPDGIIHFDDLTHYLFARWAWTWPKYLLHDWGRPGFTMLYFLPAGLGWGACRILSAVLTAAAAWLAFRVAQSWRIPSAWAVVPLCYAQPLFFQLSQTTLTETPLAFYLMCSIYAANKDRWALSAAVLSLAFITRHEAIVFLPIYLFHAFRAGAIQNPKSKINNCLALLWAPLLINFLAVLFGVTPSIKLLFAPHATSQYGHGGWLTYFARSMEAFGPGIMAMALVGLGPLWKCEAMPSSRDYAVATRTKIQNSVGFLVSSMIIYFLAQTLLRALGLYASGGYARFLVPISPLVAISALAGWHALGQAQGLKPGALEDPPRPQAPSLRPQALLAASMLLLWISMERQIVLYNQARDELAEMPQVHYAKLAIRVAAAVMVALCFFAIRDPHSRIRNILTRSAMVSLILLAIYALAGPLKPPPEAAAIRNIHAWVQQHGLAARPVISANVWIDYVFGKMLPPDRPATRQEADSAPPGTLFIWDRKFAPDDDHRLPLTSFQASPEWRLVTRVPGPSSEASLSFAVFEKIAPRYPSGFAQSSCKLDPELPCKMPLYRGNYIWMDALGAGCLWPPPSGSPTREVTR